MVHEEISIQQEMYDLFNFLFISLCYYSCEQLLFQRKHIYKFIYKEFFKSLKVIRQIISYRQNSAIAADSYCSSPLLSPPYKLRTSIVQTKINRIFCLLIHLIYHTDSVDPSSIVRYLEETAQCHIRTSMWPCQKLSMEVNLFKDMQSLFRQSLLLIHKVYHSIERITWMTVS